MLIKHHPLLKILSSSLVFSLRYECGSETAVDKSTTPTTPTPTPTTPLASTITGTAADGYLRGAKVCLDVNENGVCETAEPQDTTILKIRIPHLPEYPSSSYLISNISQ